MATYFNENTILFYDGQMMRATEAHTNLYGQTLHYGYGAFEGIRSYDTDHGPRIFKAREHYERLIRSCELLGIPFAYSVEEMTQISYKVLESNGFSDAYLRPLVICDPSMTLINGQSTRLVIAAWEWGAYLGEKLLSLKISPYCRPHPRSVHMEAKAVGHYVNSILASSDARKGGYDEALLLDCDGYLAEGPGANLFFEKDGKLYTPAQGHILPGITRATVFEMCRELGATVEEGRYTAEDLFEADSAFFCGTGAEIIGIKAIDHKEFKQAWTDSIGSKLRQMYLLLVREKTTQPVSIDA
ncbi:MAG: branched-chain amino acid transaminase [Saprospiraceae bacterium]|nr:branched-chain amino acid transaminase [Saprospiraceae bacterium]